MKKTILLIVTILAFNYSSAQFKANILQDVQADDISALYEIEITTNGSLNFSFSGTATKGTNHKRFNIGFGYSIESKRFDLTPSIIVGQNTGNNNRLFFGGDLDLDIFIIKWLSLTGKYRLAKAEYDNFDSHFYAGLKIKL